MAKEWKSLTKAHVAFIQRQHVFFVATAPMRFGRVNISPKGLRSLGVLSPRRVAYYDIVGSGNETAAHLADDGRLTLMMCAFEGLPSILRIYGNGSIHDIQSRVAHEMHRVVGEPPLGARHIVVLTVESVRRSCGFGVPFLDFSHDRPDLPEWAERLGPRRLAEYHARHGASSIDGLPASGPTDEEC